MFPKILNQNKIEHYLVVIVCIILSTFLMLLASQSIGLSGGSDSYGHYLIAKNIWNHPSLFLDQSGKPLYNLIASPFAQFGINGVICLNILCLIISGLLVYKIIPKINLKFAFLGFLLTVFSPVFYRQYHIVTHRTSLCFTCDIYNLPICL